MEGRLIGRHRELPDGGEVLGKRLDTGGRHRVTKELHGRLEKLAFPRVDRETGRTQALQNFTSSMCWDSSALNTRMSSR